MPNNINPLNGKAPIIMFVWRSQRVNPIKKSSKEKFKAIGIRRTIGILSQTQSK